MYRSSETGGCGGGGGRKEDAGMRSSAAAAAAGVHAGQALRVTCYSAGRFGAGAEAALKMHVSSCRPVKRVRGISAYRAAVLSFCPALPVGHSVIFQSSIFRRRLCWFWIRFRGAAPPALPCAEAAVDATATAACTENRCDHCRPKRRHPCTQPIL